MDFAKEKRPLDHLHYLLYTSHPPKFSQKSLLTTSSEYAGASRNNYVEYVGLFSPLRFKTGPLH